MTADKNKTWLYVEKAKDDSFKVNTAKDCLSIRFFNTCSPESSSLFRITA